ncbi:MAG: FAD-binding oxidoreductase, partial [Planctomycetia bacterium]
MGAALDDGNSGEGSPLLPIASAFEPTAPVLAVDWNEIQRDALLRRLRADVDAEIRFDAVARGAFSRDASHYEIAPLGVVAPRSQQGLQAAVAVAAEHRVPIVPRGGGTSLSGQSIGRGVVIDCRKHLYRVLEVDAERETARVEPGLVLDEFNRRLLPLGLQFGPEVATTDRASLGGMIGNNSAGSRSIVYGKTVDHVLALDAILSDGSRASLGAWTPAQIEAAVHRPDRLGDAVRAARGVVERHADEIRRRFPKVLRRVSGYNLDALLPPAPFNLAKLLVGSEGTLAVTAEATLRLVRRPPQRALAVLHFDQMRDALAAVPALVATGPSAVELIDELILDLARRHPQYRQRIDFVEGRPRALLLVEYQGESAD